MRTKISCVDPTLLNRVLSISFGLWIPLGEKTYRASKGIMNGETLRTSAIEYYPAIKIMNYMVLQTTWKNFY